MRRITGKFNQAQQHWVGNGFPVRTLLSHDVAGAAVSPFLLLDYAGPHQFGPKIGKPRGVGAHPHKGFETVTIVYEGEVEHRDSTGAGGIIGPGDVQWMTAGNGIMHQEFHSQDFTRDGGEFEMVQLWVNLPAADKSARPAYQNITADIIPLAKADGFEARVIAGDFNGIKGPTRTFTPINMWDTKLAAGHDIRLPVPEDHNTTLVLLRGALTLGETRLQGTQSLLLAPGPEDIILHADEDSLLLVLTGQPIDEPVVMYGPFVMNTEDEIRNAVADFNSGRFEQITA